MKIELNVHLTPVQIATAFCDLDDERQAQVFVEIAKIARAWDGSFLQWYSMGRHLRNCVCGDDGAREVIAEMARGIAE